MDPKTWLRMKRPLEESTGGNKEVENEEEKFPHGYALEETVKNLHEQVACLICECNVKDKLMAEHARTAQEANTGREKAEAEVAKWKRQLEDMLQQKVAANERLVHLNAALKNCRQQLSSSKVEHDRRVNLEREHKRLESKYTEARKKLADLTIDNARLTKLLVKKEEIIKYVSDQMSEATAEFNVLISRLDSTERGNNVLKYEYRALARELKMKNRRAIMENRQHQENAKNVRKLEADRQRLRLLVSKRIPGNAKTKPSNHPKAAERRMSVMIKRLCEVEEENKILKESACKRENETRLLKAELTRIRCDEQNIGIAKQYKMIGDLGISRMDDHDDMEKVVVKDNPDMVCKELVSELQGYTINSSEKDYGWLQSVVQEILEQNDDSERSFDEVLEDVKIAFQCRYHSSSMAVKGRLINKLDEMKHVHKDMEAKFLESQTRIVALETELGSLKESKRMMEDHIENLKLINVDLDHQLSAAKVEIKEALRKVSILDMELEDKSHQLEALKVTCIELQLQLASVCSKDVVSEDIEPGRKKLETGLESKNENLSQHSSLRDHMAADDGVGPHDLQNSPLIKEIISKAETIEPTVPRCSTTYGVKNVIPWALPVVPHKKRNKGTGLLRKLLFRRKRGRWVLRLVL